MIENFKLRVFRVVADTLNFRRAGEELHLTQPAGPACRPSNLSIPPHPLRHRFHSRRRGAAAYAVSLAETLKADIDVLNVIPGEDVHHPERLRDLERSFYRALDELVPEQAREFCHPRTFVETGGAHDRILQHIRDREIDLLFAAPCPVLTVTG